MRALKTFFQKKHPREVREIDEKTIFFLFYRGVEKAYGERGRLAIQPLFFRDGVLSVKTKSPLWANELWLQKQSLIEGVNKEVGQTAVSDLKLLH